MRKRKSMGRNAGMVSTTYQDHSPYSPYMPRKTDFLYGKVAGRRPAARDGHTGIIHDGLMLVFGGDRHHMPFNDTFILDVK